MKIATAQTVAAIERLARADRRHAATVEQWDADPWLLNTPGGTVDLRTGKLHRHQSGQYLTKITGASPGNDCPLWRCFLDRVTDGNYELQAFLQRVIGYCLTGSTREHALFFLYGTGANGKSVFYPRFPYCWVTTRRLRRHHRSRRIRPSNTRPTWRVCAEPDSSPPSRRKMAQGGLNRR